MFDLTASIKQILITARIIIPINIRTANNIRASCHHLKGKHSGIGEGEKIKLIIIFFTSVRFNSNKKSWWTKTWWWWTYWYSDVINIGTERISCSKGAALSGPRLCSHNWRGRVRGRVEGGKEGGWKEGGREGGRREGGRVEGGREGGWKEGGRESGGRKGKREKERGGGREGKEREEEVRCVYTLIVCTHGSLTINDMAFIIRS